MKSHAPAIRAISLALRAAEDNARVYPGDPIYQETAESLRDSARRLGYRLKTHDPKEHAQPHEETWP